MTIYDLVQSKHAILRNFPIIGHFRYIIESVGPELRQYIVTSNNEERPFSRDERRWVYSSSKRQNNLFGFGTDDDLESRGHTLVLKHAAFPWPDPPASAAGDVPHPLPAGKVLGAARGRRRAFRPASVVNISGMSFGSLSAVAIEAMNRGSVLAGCLQNTGEGGVADCHRHGADLIWQVGTGYFGCRDERGRFSLARLVETCEKDPIRAIEIKLSQGAKPGKGGILPAAKVSPAIAAVRGVPAGIACRSPSRHAEFDDVDRMLDFVEEIAETTGLPVGIKSAVGEQQFWIDLARLMDTTGRGVDFVTVDGAEGGTGAAPLVYADHVALPFKIAMSRVYPAFAERGLHERVVFAGSGRLGFPEEALFAMALGCDLIMVGREAMLAIGCIQSQTCHTGRCPTGVATQSRWLTRGLDPATKSVRLANYVVTLREELGGLARSLGVPHPAFVTGDHLELVDERFGSVTVREHFGYRPAWGVPSAADREAVQALVDATAPAASSPAVS